MIHGKCRKLDNFHIAALRLEHDKGDRLNRKMKNIQIKKLFVKK